MIMNRWRWFAEKSAGSRGKKKRKEERFKMACRMDGWSARPELFCISRCSVNLKAGDAYRMSARTRVRSLDPVTASGALAWAGLVGVSAFGGGGSRKKEYRVCDMGMRMCMGWAGWDEMGMGSLVGAPRYFVRGGIYGGRRVEFSE
ncbi:hypothetical protein FB451DRAFT_1367498 [Mycena latifolia]|nr:hypothetical protein FB451DRAFT_1367498 [Mycena latifolia]